MKTGEKGDVLIAQTPGVRVSIGPTQINDGGLGSIGRIHLMAMSTEP